MLLNDSALDTYCVLAIVLDQYTHSSFVFGELKIKKGSHLSFILFRKTLLSDAL